MNNARRESGDAQRAWTGRLGRQLVRVAILFGAAWMGLSILAGLFYPRLLYHPDRRESGVTPKILGAVYEEFRLTAGDGVTLHGWRLPAHGESAKNGRTLLVFHGNAGNLGTAAQRLVMYSGLGCDVYMIDYPGYGKSGGEPSEAGLYLSAEAVWRYVTGERGVPEESVVIMGYSLGGAVAAWLAEKHPGAAGLILESTFTCLSDVAADFFPYLPCRLIVGNAYDTFGRLANLPMPLLVIHGKGDALVAFRHGEKIFSAFRGTKRFLRIGDDHNLGYLAFGDTYAEGVGSFVGSVGSPPALDLKK